MTRRRFLLGGVGVSTLLLAGCGRGRGVEAKSSPQTDVGQRASPVAAAGASAAVPSPTPTLIPPVPTVTPTPPPPTPTSVKRAAPRELEIPKIGITARIEGIGTLPTGELGAPEEPQTVGWFVGGPRPGEPGNAILTGHLDWRTGETGVFWRLKELAPGDQIYVKTDGERIAFVVESTNVYDRDKAPADRILGFAIGMVMTIVTCEGDFIPAERDYTKRRVVRARIV